MAQVLKEELRARIYHAAAVQFAAKGFEETRLSDIARCAGTAVSNLYKYEKDKGALFLRVVTPELVERHTQLLHARLNEFQHRDAWQSLVAEGSSSASELLDFWCRNRHAVAILMSRGHGTQYESMRHEMIEEMTMRALLRFTQKNDPTLPFVLRRIFSGSLDVISAILQTYDLPRDIGHAIQHFWRFQLAGLEALLKVQEGKGK